MQNRGIYNLGVDKGESILIKTTSHIHNYMIINILNYKIF